MKATDTLRWEHETLRAVLGVIQREARRIQQSARPNRDLLRKAADLFCGLGQRCHHAKEHEGLLPELGRRPMFVDLGSTAGILEAHAASREHVGTLTGLIAETSRGPLDRMPTVTQDILEQAEILRFRLRNEEQGLFGLADEVLSDEHQKALGRAFEAIEAATIGKGGGERYYRMARELVHHSTDRMVFWQTFCSDAALADSSPLRVAPSAVQICSGFPNGVLQGSGQDNQGFS